jgi:hypothetical protein
MMGEWWMEVTMNTLIGKIFLINDKIIKKS